MFNIPRLTDRISLRPFTTHRLKKGLLQIFFFFFSQYSWPVICSFQIYNIVVQHLHILWNDHYYKSNSHLSPHEIIKIQLNIFLMLYISVTYLSYNWRLFNLLIPFAYFATAPLPSFLYLWVCFHFILFVFLIKIYILHVSESMQYLSFPSVCFIGKNPVTTFRDSGGYDFNVWTEGTQLSP